MTNLTNIIEEHLGSEYREILDRISHSATKTGLRVYLVGGSVRDLILGFTPSELDLAVSGESTDPIGSLATSLSGVVYSKSEFGTAKLDIDGIRLDMARTRREKYVKPGALPTVEFTRSIKEDLSRRDFTINAMAISLNMATRWELIDPFEGSRDLASKQIRVLHRRSFVDDATRILRAIRYATRLSLDLVPETSILIENQLSYLGMIHGDRIRHELIRIFSEEKQAEILNLAESLGILRAIHPSLGLNNTIVSKLQESSRRPGQVVLGSLAFEASNHMRSSLKNRLSLSANWSRIIEDIGHVKTKFEQLSEKRLSPSQIYGILSQYDTHAIEACSISCKDTKIRKRLELYLQKLLNTSTIMDGKNIIALGLSEGPNVGKLLSHLLDAKLDGLVPTREDEEQFILTNIIRISQD